MEYRIEVLAGRVRCGGSVVDMQHRPLELAMALATHASSLSAHALCALMYPELDDAAAAHRLRVNASRLREAAPGLLSHAHARTYALTCASVDLDEIARALRAREDPRRFASLLQVLPELARAARDDVTQRWSWFTAVDARVESLRTDVCAALNIMPIPHEFADDTLQIARELLAQSRSDEGAYILAVRALCALGRRVDALRLYRDYERTIREEYGIDPARTFDHLVRESVGVPTGDMRTGIPA